MDSVSGSLPLQCPEHDSDHKPVCVIRTLLFDYILSATAPVRLFHWLLRYIRDRGERRGEMGNEKRGPDRLDFHIPVVRRVILSSHT